MIHTRDTMDWLSTLEPLAVPYGPINDLAAVFTDPHVQARALLQELPHATAGTVPTVANPIRYSATPIEHTMAPPPLGAHTGEILGDRLGLRAADIEALRSKGVI